MNVSGYVIGGVLSQEQDGKWKPIAFLSRTMQPVERNYEICDKKLLIKIVNNRLNFYFSLFILFYFSFFFSFLCYF